MDKDESLPDPFRDLVPERPASPHLFSGPLAPFDEFPMEKLAQLAKDLKDVLITRRDDWQAVLRTTANTNLEREKTTMAKTTATMPKLDCLDEGWGWLEEASIRIGDPVFVGATPESSYYNWIWAWETTIGTKPHVIIRGHCNSRGEVSLWEVSAANNKVGMPDTGYQCARQPTSEEIIKLMDSAGLFALTAVPKEA